MVVWWWQMSAAAGEKGELTGLTNQFRIALAVRGMPDCSENNHATTKTRRFGRPSCRRMARSPPSLSSKPLPQLAVSQIWQASYPLPFPTSTLPPGPAKDGR